MTEIRKKGVITFTAGRSGSSWLGSLVSSTGDMGVSGEWLDMNILPKPRKSFDANSFFTHVLKSSSSDNGRFSMKVFPQHLRDTTEVFNVDLIRKFALEHNVAFALLVREDRVGQAISLLRARQTGIWGSRTTKNETAPPRYSFKRLCLAYFHLCQSYDFWRSYLAINELPYQTFTYESLLVNSAPFLEYHAAHFGVDTPNHPTSELEIQRDETNNAWRERFQKDISERGIHPAVYELPQPKASLGNAVKTLLGHPLKPDLGGARI